MPIKGQNSSISSVLVSSSGRLGEPWPIFIHLHSAWKCGTKPSMNLHKSLLGLGEEQTLSDKDQMRPLSALFVQDHSVLRLVQDHRTIK